MSLQMAEVDWVDGLKVVQLKKELKARGEPTSGRKSELVIRLKEKLKVVICPFVSMEL